MKKSSKKLIKTTIQKISRNNHKKFSKKLITTTKNAAKN